MTRRLPDKPLQETAPRVGDTINLLGLRIHRVTEHDVVEHVIASLQNGAGGWIATPNSDHLRVCSKSPDTWELVHQADWLVADGMPLVWASWLQGTALPERVAGSNLVWSLAQAGAEHGASIFLLGGDEGVAETAAGVFQERFPELRVVGVHVPPLGFEDDLKAMHEIEEVLMRAHPDIVYVALGFPKQERLIVRLRHVLPEAWFLGIGISLSFVSGDVPRAPSWMHSLGLEWLHRLTVEPGRLFSRYVRHGIPFVIAILARSAVVGLRRGRGHQRALRRLGRRA